MEHDWIALNAAATSSLNALLDRLTPADHARSEDGWSISAMLAHLAFWDRRGAIILAAWDAGHDPRRLDDDFYDSHVLNDALIPEWIALSGPESARLVREAAANIDTLVASLKPTTVEAVAAMDELWRLRRHNHRMEHVNQIAALLSAR